MNDDDDIIFVKVFKFKNHFEIDAKYAYDLNTFLSAVPGSCKTQNLLNFSWAIPNEYLDTVCEYIRNHKQYRLRINEIKNRAYLFYFKNYICIKCDFDKYDVSEFEFEFLLAAAPLPEGKNEWLVPSIYYDYLKQFFQKLHINQIYADCDSMGTIVDIDRIKPLGDMSAKELKKFYQKALIDDINRSSGIQPINN